MKKNKRRYVMFNPDLFMDMLKNKEQMVKMILKDLEACNKNSSSFKKLETLYKEGKEVNLEKAMTAFATTIKHMNDANERMLIILLTYISGDNFTSDVGKVLMKFGKGQEALQEMLKQKMNS
jgi:hypothetical protein